MDEVHRAVPALTRFKYWANNHEGKAFLLLVWVTLNLLHPWLILVSMFLGGTATYLVSLWRKS